MWYYLSYDEKNPAILLSLDSVWLFEILESDAGSKIIGEYKTTSSPFQLEEGGIGFGGVMKPMAENSDSDNCPTVFTQYRLDLPILFREDPEQKCLFCHDEDDSSNCEYCKGTGHDFRIEHEAGDDFGKTLSVVTQVIDQAVGQGLCDYKPIAINGQRPEAEQPLHLVFGYRTEGEHLIRLWISPDAYAVLNSCCSVFPNLKIAQVEEAISSAFRHIRDGSSPEVRPQAFMQPSWLLLGPDDRGGLIQTDRWKSDSPLSVEMFSHDLEFADSAFAMIAGIAAFYPVCLRGSQAFRQLQRDLAK